MRKCKEIIENLVSPDEKLVWCGKPRQGIIFRMSDIIMIPLSGVFFGFSVFWLHMVLTAAYPPPGIFYFVGSAFLFISSYNLFGRFFADRSFRRRTCYGITSNRVIIDYGSPYKTFRTLSKYVAIPNIPTQSFEISELPKIELRKRENLPYGTICFGLPPAYKSWWGGRGGGSAVVVETEFNEIENPVQVYELLTKIKSREITAV
jgi:hypothetical protein